MRNMFRHLCRPGLRHMLVPACVWVATLGLYSAVDAIEVDPTQDQIEQALQRGKRAAEARVPPDRLYAWFGSAEALEPHGFFMTKLAGLAVMATHFALRGETPSQGEIDRILGQASLLVSVVIYGDRPDFAVDSYILLVQAGRTLKPSRVRFDGRATRSVSWPSQPAYRAKVVAHIPYALVDPTARTQLSVFPGSGGEVSFELDLAQIE